MSPQQTGCETCLELQKDYSAALRLYADAVEQRIVVLEQGSVPTTEAIATINSADWVCSEARMMLERHDSQSHPKIRTANR